MNNKCHERTKTKTSCIMAICVSACLVLMAACKSKQTLFKERLDGFEDKANKAIDFQKVQDWAIVSIKKYDREGGLYNDAPSCIMKFETNNLPGLLFQSPDPVREKIVVIFWRTDYGIKGIWVGPPTADLMTIPDPWHRELRPGIVIFCSE